MSTPASIPAILTGYNGVQYRSRLKARLAGKAKSLEQGTP